MEHLPENRKLQAYVYKLFCLSQYEYHKGDELARGGGHWVN